MLTSDIIRQGLIERSVGNNLENDVRDVLAVKDGLSRSGFFDFSSNKTEPHGIITREMDDGIKSFQKSKGLRVDGWLHPKGETEGALIQEVGAGFKGLKIEPLEKKPKPQPSCKNQEVAWTNAAFEVAIIEQNYRRSKSKKKQLEKKLAMLQQGLLELTEVIKKEKIDSRNAKIAGGGFGTVAGGALGAPGGVGTMALLAALGLGAGSKIGVAFEEVHDIISPESETDFSLTLKKQRTVKEINSLKSSIETVQNNIDNIILSKLKLAEEKARRARGLFQECQRTNR